MFNKNRKTKKSLLISTYECLISHYNFIENNNNLYLYGKKDKTKKSMFLAIADGYSCW